MSRKIIKIILIVLIVLAITAFIAVKVFLASMDQVKLQYDKEKISDHMRQLDFSPYDQALTNVNSERFKQLEDYLLEENISRIRERLEMGDLTCEEIVLFYVNRIKTYDAYYHSVLQLNPNALSHARHLDEKIQSGEGLVNLEGVVILIKDNIASEEMNTASGSYALKDLTTKRDAFIIKELRDQGAIILGKTNLSEWSNFMSMPSSNGFSVLGGQTKNAYGKYDVGGSSSGSSVAMSLNFANITLGSETAGSLIYPAGQNSVVALKPTMGLLSRDLIIPISEAQDTAGLIANSVVDLRTVFKVMIKNDPTDTASGVVDTFDLSTLETTFSIHYLEGKKFAYIDNGSKELQSIIKEFEALGAEVIEVSFDKSAYDVDMLSVLYYGIKNDVNAFLANESVVSEMKSLDQIVTFNQTDKARMPFGQAYLEDGLKKNLSKDAYDKIVAKNRLNTQTAIDHLLDEHQVEAIISMSNDLSGVYAIAGYPAITLPSGYRSSGEPYGVTLISGQNSDGRLIDIAYAYEMNTKHRKLPVTK